MNCPTNEQLQSYYDNELPENAHAEIDAHLKSCDACRLQLRQFGAMSGLLAQGAFPGLSQMARARLHKQLGSVMDRGLIRLAWSLSGIAAAVLVGGLVWMQTSSPAPQQAAAPQAAPPWVDAMVAAHPLTRDASSPAAEFYLADASLRVDELP